MEGGFAGGQSLDREDEEEEEEEEDRESLGGSSNDAVVCRENGEFVKTCDQIPASGDVSCNEDAESEDGERVHRSES